MRYIAVVEGGYIRDAQIYFGDPAKIDEADYNCADERDNENSQGCDDNTFFDLKYPRHFVGVFDGATEDEILRKAADKQGVHPDTITLIPIDDTDDEIYETDDTVEKVICLYRWLRRKRFRDKNYILTRDNIKIDREIEYYDGEACVYIEVWFDVEKKFGLKLSGNENINVYAYISREDVRVAYVVNYTDGLVDDERPFNNLTQSEKALIREMTNEVSLSETGKTVDEELEGCGEE